MSNKPLPLEPNEGLIVDGQQEFLQKSPEKDNEERSEIRMAARLSPATCFDCTYRGILRRHRSCGSPQPYLSSQLWDRIVGQQPKLCLDL